MLIWNIGVNTTIVLFFANRNYKRIDLTKGASFNWEGVGATQMLLGFPLFILPFVFYAPLALFKHADIGLAILAIVGLAFVLTRNYWIAKLETDFSEKRYKIAEGFRDK
jgi:ABC-type proline/glycine betaine transport system permease subunit